MNRITFAVATDGTRVVRMPQKGTWMVEREEVKAERISLSEAVAMAVSIKKESGVVTLGLSGGNRFDSLYERERLLSVGRYRKDSSTARRQ